MPRLYGGTDYTPEIVSADLQDHDGMVIPRNASGQGHSTANFPVRNAGGRSTQLLIYTITPI
jgi:hypothetical protein